ncbi:MAG: sulfurtransferase TusA family protein [Rickettsiales bacterium]|nr:sulfurtransferase TusA family protein [Rickettsiales bacterium]
MTSDNSHQQQLDLRGLRCPMPVIQLNKHMRTVTAGMEVMLRVSESKTVSEIKDYCTTSGNQFVSETDEGADEYLLVIRKSGSPKAST